MNHDFQIGETLEYDIHYVSGTPNHLTRIIINNEPLMENNYPLGIGYFDEESYPKNTNLTSRGMQNYIIHVKVDFLSDRIKVILSNFGKVYTTYFYGINSPYHIGVNSRSFPSTNYVGTFHFDYDNFVITSPYYNSSSDSNQISCQCEQSNFTNLLNELQSRLDQQQLEIQNLTQRISILENKTYTRQEIDVKWGNLNRSIRLLENKVNNLINKLNKLFPALKF